MVAPTPTPKEIKVIRPPIELGRPVLARTTGLELPTRTLVFDHLPTLKRDLLRQNGGIPGYYYLVVAIQGQKVAEREGWKPVTLTDGIDTFTIQGPDGAVDARLYCFGEKLPSANYQSSKRTIEYDKNIGEITGLVVAESTLEEKQTVGTESTVETVVEPTVDEANVDLVATERKARRGKGAQESK